MDQEELQFTIDGRKVLVNQVTQEVRVFDESGRMVFEDRLQVAAGSVQGIFEPVNPSQDN